MREATALVVRAELSVPSFNEPVVIGFRRDGCGSIYVGADPVWHFNSDNQLRRAYRGGKLIKAERGRLVSLQRRRLESEVQLLRHRLDDRETEQLLEQTSRHVDQLRRSITSGSCATLARVPDNDEVEARIRAWLESFRGPIPIARVPGAR